MDETEILELSEQEKSYWWHISRRAILQSILNRFFPVARHTVRRLADYSASLCHSGKSRICGTHPESYSLSSSGLTRGSRQKNKHKNSSCFGLDSSPSWQLSGAGSRLRGDDKENGNDKESGDGIRRVKILDVGCGTGENIKSNYCSNEVRTTGTDSSRLTPRTIKILDVGCGTGSNMQWLQEFGVVTGVDSSKTAVALANSATDRMSPELIDGLNFTPPRAQVVEPACRQAGGYIQNQALLGRAEQLPFADGSFDVLTAFDVLEHIKNDNQVLKEWGRVLSDKGLIYLTVPAHQWLFGPHDRAMGHYRRYSMRQLGKLLSQNGFKPIFTTYIFSSTFPIFLLQRVWVRNISVIRSWTRSDTELARMADEGVDRQNNSSFHYLGADDISSHRHSGLASAQRALARRDPESRQENKQKKILDPNLASSQSSVQDDGFRVQNDAVRDMSLTDKSQYVNVPKWLNNSLISLGQLEANWVKFSKLPFGSSIVVLAQKKDNNPLTPLGEYYSSNLSKFRHSGEPMGRLQNRINQSIRSWTRSDTEELARMTDGMGRQVQGDGEVTQGDREGMAPRFKTIKQFLKFAIVGMGNTAIDFGVLNLLVQIFHWAVLPANVISFSLAVTNSYFFTKYWTFQDKSAKSFQQFGYFMAVNLLGLGISTLIIKYGLPMSEIYWSDLVFSWRYNIVKLVSVVIIWVCNFLFYKFIIFGQRKSSII
ncbi:MAG: GtrA family protein [Patescibacteria group bacterium]